MKYTLLIAFTVLFYSAQAQTDMNIVDMILGEKFINVPNKLKAAGIWNHYHFRNTQTTDGSDSKDKFMSIQNGAGHTKVWVLAYNKENVVTEIRINCRHDDRGQVEDIEKMVGYTDYHIGVFSTDYIFKLKK
jgi:hypothetical protein